MIFGVYLRGSCTFSFCDKFIFISLLKVMGFNKCISDKVLTKKIYFSHENVNIKKIWNEPKTRKILNFLELIWIIFIYFLISCSTTLQTKIHSDQSVQSFQLQSKNSLITNQTWNQLANQTRICFAIHQWFSIFLNISKTCLYDSQYFINLLRKIFKINK